MEFVFQDRPFFPWLNYDGSLRTTFSLSLAKEGFSLGKLGKKI
jgi:hypothetical protein